MQFNDFFKELFKMPLWDGDDFIGFVARFAMHFAVLIFVVRYLYFRSSRRKDYFFTYIMLSVVIFMLCFMLESVKLQLGMALGLFAVFGIIRYRTSQIPIREMTYLFLVIGLAVVNALANKKISISELVFANAGIVVVTWVIERASSLKHVSRKVVMYDKIQLILPEKYEELKQDLEQRLGLNIIKIEVGRVDFLRDSAKLVVYYSALASDSNTADDIEYAGAGTEDDE